MNITPGSMSLVVVNYGTSELVLRLLETLSANTDAELIGEVIIVDNGYPNATNSKADVGALSLPFPVKVIGNPGRSYASGVNRGATASSGRFLAIANNDIALLPRTALRALIRLLEENAHLGVVGPQLVFPDGRWQRSYGPFPSIGEGLRSVLLLDSVAHGLARLAFRYGWQSGRRRLVDYVDGAFMVVRRSCFEQLEGFNEDYSFYCEDSEFCWRARLAGWAVTFFPEVQVVHVGGATSAAMHLTEYTIRLVEAKREFVRRFFGEREARYYQHLLRFALLERHLLSALVAKLSRSAWWNLRAQRARIRYAAVASRWGRRHGGIAS